MHQLYLRTTAATPNTRAETKPRARTAFPGIEAAMRFGRWASLAIVPTVALIGSVVGGPSATEAFLTECTRIYTSAACACAAGRAERTVGSTRFAQVSGEIFMHPQLLPTATQLVQSCMLGGANIAD
jgi:hypothetical protein